MPHQEQYSYYHNYNVDDTAYKFGRIRGPFAGGIGVKTSGSSTTVTAFVAGKGAFSSVKVGDILWFRLSDVTIHKRKVATKVSDDEITVDTAVDLDNSGNGYPAWDFLPFDIGTADTDGWQRSGHLYQKQVVLIATSIGDAGGITFRLEGSIYAPSFSTVRPKPVLITPEIVVPQASAPYTQPVLIGEEWAAIRVGVKGTSGFAGTDDISAYLIGSPVNG